MLSPLSRNILGFLLLVIPPWEGSFLLPSHSFPMLLPFPTHAPSCSFPLLLPLPTHHNTHTHHPINLRFLSQNTEPALHRIYLQHFPVFTRFSSSQQQMILVLSPFHRAPCFFWIGVWFCFFCFRSTRLLPLVQDMTLSNRFLGFSGVRRWSPSSPPPSGCRRVSPTRPRASKLNRRVMHLPASSIFPCFLPRRILMKLGFPAAERLSLGGACSGWLPPVIHPILCCCCWFFLYVFLGLCFVSFSPCLPLLFWCLGPCDSIHLRNHLQW
jgi:hypothetical protein